MKQTLNNTDQLKWLLENAQIISDNNKKNNNNEPLVNSVIVINENDILIPSNKNYHDTNTDEIKSELQNLLREFDLEIIYPDLKSAGVTFRCLKYLKRDDIAEVIKHIGYRVEFREKLFAWKKKKYGIDNDTITMSSKVSEWILSLQKEDYPATFSPASTLSVNSSEMP